MQEITYSTFAILFAIALTSCSSNAVDEKQQEIIQEMETVQEELEQVTEEIESETEDMTHDVDSLLEGI